MPKVIAGGGAAVICLDVLERDVATVSEHDDVRTAALLMQQRGAQLVAVCDERGRPVGTLTARDVALRVLAADLRPSEIPVGRAMSRELALCRPFDEAAAAEQLMSSRGVSWALVVGDDGTLVGVVSREGLAAAEEAERSDERSGEGPHELH